MDDIFDIAGFDDFNDDADFPPTVVPADYSPDQYYARSKQYWMQVPFPPECVPCGGAPLADLDDETLLTMSPTLLMHAQRTAASGGLQVISPRTVPLASAAAHTNLSHRTTDMFIAGSNASRNMAWPVLRDPIPDYLFPEEPIDSYPSTPAIRPPTKTVGIAAAAKSVADPVVRAFLTGRALVDLQRRPDVAGSGDALAAHIAASWGLPPETYDSMAEASLAPMGPLLRYAARADTAYPVLNAPVHARKCISVGANTAGRTLYGEDAAIDWRRIRVLCEAVFYMSARIEGHSLSALALSEPPGDPRANPNRAGVLQMRPLPGSVWSHAPSTFRLDISRVDPPPAAIEFPERIEQAMAQFYDTARPAAVTAWAGESIDLVPTIVRQPTTRTREALVSGYLRTMTLTSNFSSRGKTSVAAVRDYVYQALTGSSNLAAVRTLWLTRYLRETADACAMGTHLDTVLVRQLASRLSDMTHDMRIRLSVEAGRRGTTLDEWWNDMRSSLPGTLAHIAEGSAAWAIATAYFLLHPYSVKWANLAKAMAVASHQAMASGMLSSVRLPAEIGSAQRVFEAGTATVRSLGASYGAYYSAMYEAGCMLSAQMKRLGNTVASYKLRIAAQMWDIRAKAASSVVLHVADGTSTEAGVIPSPTGPYHITTAPYPAYQRWHAQICSGRIVSMDSRRNFPYHVEGPVENAFAGVRTPLFPLGAQGASRLFRYVANPSKLAEDIRRTLSMILHDAAKTIEQYDREEKPTDVVWEEPEPGRPSATQFSMLTVRPQSDSYWEQLAGLDQLTALDTEDLLAELPIEKQDEIMAGVYSSPMAVRATVLEANRQDEELRAEGRDAVV